MLAKLTGAGAHVWSVRFGDASPQNARGVATDPSSNVLFAGVLQGSADFGLGPLASAGSDDVFVVKVAP